MFQKAYQQLYKSSSGDARTLNDFKEILHQSNVNGSVKGKYKAHEEMFLHIAEGFIMEQVLEYFAMDNYDSLPISEDIPDNIENRSRAIKKEVADKILLKFLNHYQYADFSIDEDSMFLLNPPEAGSEEDRVMSYASNVCMWGIHMLHLIDMAKEGDITRTSLAMKLNIPFFSHILFTASILSNPSIIC